ncbi:MAG: hypothetical protein U1E47_09670 [Rivihabitans pingtungensis]
MYWLNSEYTRQHALFRQRASAGAQTVSAHGTKRVGDAVAGALMRTQSQLGMQDVQFTQQLMQRYPHIYSIQFFEIFCASRPRPSFSA